MLSKLVSEKDLLGYNAGVRGGHGVPEVCVSRASPVTRADATTSLLGSVAQFNLQGCLQIKHRHLSVHYIDVNAIHDISVPT
jgi:hypothetical protein